MEALNIPAIMTAFQPLNPKFRVMVETWKRLPLPVANLLGPVIARQIG